MKRPFLLTAIGMLLAGTGTTAAQVESPDAGGYLRRGILMFENRNYGGCIDQLARINSLTSTSAQREEALFYLGKATLGLGDDEALLILRRFLNDYPVSPLRADVMMSVGDYYFHRGEYSDALREYLLVDPAALTTARMDEMNYRQAYCYMLLGETDTAAALLRTLLNKKEWSNAARFYLGYIAYSRKNFTEATSYFKGVDTTTAPGNAVPYYEAQMAFARGEYDTSLAGAKKLLAAGTVPEFTAECNRIAGESLYNLGRSSEAMPYLWKYCAETKTPAPSAFYILGVDEFDKGDVDASIKLFQQAIGSHSAMEQSAWLFLGQAYLKRGDKTSAMMAFENAYKVNHDRTVRETAFYNYAVARMDGGRAPFGNSVALLENFLEEYPDSRYAGDVRRFIVNGYMTDNDYTAALAAINKVSRPTTEMLEAKQRVLFVLGTREYSAGRVADAISHLSEARNIKDGNAAIRRQCDFWLGDCYYTRGNYDDAAKCYMAYFNATPKSDAEGIALMRYALGYTRFQQEKYDAALNNFTDASALASRLPANDRIIPDIYTRMADCRYYMNDYAAAAEDYKKAYDLNPSTGDYPLYQLAIMKGLLRDHKEKIALIDRMVEKFPSSGLVPGALLEKAESQAATGSTEAAIHTYSELVRLYPGTAPGRNGYLQLAITHINRGEKAKGVETYKKVIYTFPSSEEARIAADDLKQIYAADGKLNEFVAFINSVPNAPRFEPDDIERAAFTAAENAYINSGATAGLESSVRDYPQGSSRARALYLLAENAWNSDKAAEAQGYASQVLLEYPDSEVAEDALLVKGQAEAALGKTEIAYSTFLELEHHASGANMLRAARLGLLNTAADMGKYADVVVVADKILTTTAATSPTDMNEVRFTRAMANDRLGNTEAAYEDWEALAANTSDINGAKSAYYLGQSLLDRGKTDRAEKVADSLISSDTPHRYWLARGFILYSDILRKQGKTFEANEYLKSLRSNYPGSEADIFLMIDSRLSNTK